MLTADILYIRHKGSFFSFQIDFYIHLNFYEKTIMLYLSRRECYENNGLYHALQLETMFNINSFLNRTVVSGWLEWLKAVYMDFVGIADFLLGQDKRHCGTL